MNRFGESASNVLHNQLMDVCRDIPRRHLIEMEQGNKDLLSLFGGINFLCIHWILRTSSGLRNQVPDYAMHDEFKVIHQSITGRSSVLTD